MIGQSNYPLVEVLIYMVLLSSINDVLTGADAKAQPPQGKNAFEVFASSGLDAVAPYARMPGETDALRSNDYPQVVREFDWWLRHAVHSEYVPGVAFVEKQLLLIPSAKRNGKEDLAFLTYELAGTTYMIVQTGGLGARMWIFLEDPAQAQAQSPADAATTARGVLAKYLNDRIRAYLPEFGVKKSNELYIGEAEPSQDKKQVNHARWFLVDGKTCIIIQKLDFEGTLPGREPLPNEWFSWWKVH